MDSIYFSFVLPAYKSNFIFNTIKSILNQSYSHFELIIINDCSPDNSLKNVIFSFKDDRIRYYENKVNIGEKDLIANWNKCVLFAKNEYLILASDDDVYEKDFLMESKNLIEKYPNVDIIRSRVCKINELDEIIKSEIKYNEYMSQIEFIYNWQRNMIKCISNYIYKRKKFIENGGFINFPIAWCSDDATSISMAKNGICTTPNINFKFRDSGKNLSTTYTLSLSVKKLNAIKKFNSWFFNNISSIKSEEYYFDKVIQLHPYVINTMIKHIILTAKKKDIIKILYMTNKLHIISSTELFRLVKLYIRKLLY